MHAIDTARLTPRYWLLFGLVMLQLVFEIFDFVIVGYLVSAIAPDWHLTFGQITAILTAAGIGAIFGSLVFGALADRIGRRHTILISAAIYTIAAGSISLLSAGDWAGFALLRLVVGFGYAGCVTAQFTLVTEWTPSRYRILLTSSLSMPASLGVMLAAGTFAAFFPVIGWRGIAALGYLPLAVAMLIWLTTPESARWLLVRGRRREAEVAFSTLLGGREETSLQEIDAPPAQPAGSYRAIFADQRRFWLVVLPNVSIATALSGVLLWAPMLLSLALGVPPAEAARQTIVITLAGLCGRLLFTYLPHRIGRVAAGQIIGYGGALALLAVSLLHDATIGPFSVLLVALVVGQIFYEGGFANVLTYAAEIYPTRLASRAMGLGQAAGGVGKMLGPLLLGLLAGSGTAATAVATRSAITPGFLALAVCCLAGALTYSIAGIETNRRDLPA